MEELTDSIKVRELEELCGALDSKLRRMRKLLNALTSAKLTCKYCRGSGRLKNTYEVMVKCPYCNGQGFLSRDQKVATLKLETWVLTDKETGVKQKSLTVETDVTDSRELHWMLQQAVELVNDGMIIDSDTNEPS